MKILNLTQHYATPEQIQAGVVDYPEGSAELSALKFMLNFEQIPSAQEIFERAEGVAEMAAMYDLAQAESGGVEEYPRAAMIGGAPFLMAALEKSLKDRGVKPLYAFSTRESIEETQPDGSVRKVNVFRHDGFVGLSS